MPLPDVHGLHSRAYLRHLFKVGEPSGPRLLTWHNLAWQLGLMADIRAAVAGGRLDEMRARLTRTWA